MRSFARSVTILVAACGLECGGARQSRPSPSSSQPLAAGQTVLAVDSAFALAVDSYVASFGRNWGETAAFSGYIAIARDGRAVFAKAYQQADRERGIVAGPDTLYRIGSTTKSFTALGIMQLAEQGLLQLDDPVRKFLPELPAIADPITIRHCLTHTSGIPPLTEDTSLASETGAMHPVGAAFAAYRDQSLLFKPGERFEYSNAGYTILGAIIERVSRQSYEAYFRDHVFGPAGMTRTTTVSIPLPPNMALGYQLSGTPDSPAIERAPSIPYVTFGSGAILSTADDLIAFSRALAADKLLSRSAKQLMFTPYEDAGLLVGLPAQYGFGWFVAREMNHAVLIHPGGVEGFDASFALIPDLHLTVIVLSNLSAPRGLVTRIASAVRDLVSTGRVPETVEEPRDQLLTEAQIGQLAGDYEIDEASLAALPGEFPLTGFADTFLGLSLKRTDGRVFAKLAGGGAWEVFGAADGHLFTKRDFALDVVRTSGESAAVLRLLWGEFPAKPVLFNRLEPRFAESPTTCPVDMIGIPGGNFIMSGEHEVVGAFCLDRTEVTVDGYRKCTQAGLCTPVATTASWPGITAGERAKWSSSCNGTRLERANHPVNCVAWAEAVTYCKARGRRLPTEAEWQWAARGADEARTYPWGYRAPDTQLCWSGKVRRDGTCAHGAAPDGFARGGIEDLAGNVWEWTSSQGTEGGQYLIKGGSWNMDDPSFMRASSRLPTKATFRGPSVGFRCAR